MQNDLPLQFTSRLSGEALQGGAAVNLAPHTRPNQLVSDCFFRVDNYVLPDQVFQLADISRPIVMHEEAHQIGGDASNFRVVMRHEPLHEITNEVRYVTAALAKRWDLHVNYVDPVEQ